MIPILIKQRLLELSKRLPHFCRGDFLRNVVERLEDTAVYYPRTVFWSITGVVVGNCLDSLVGIPLTIPLFVIGGAFGITRDIQAQQMEEHIRQLIAEEFNAFYER